MLGDGRHLVGQQAGTGGVNPVAKEILSTPQKGALGHVELQASLLEPLETRPKVLEMGGSVRAGDQNVVNIDKDER